MGLILDRNEWSTRLSAENALLSQAAEGLMSLRDSLSSYSNSRDLAGTAYDAAREYYQQVAIPFCHAAAEACTVKSDANNAFLETMNSAFADIGETVIDQDALQAQVDLYNARIAQCEALLLSASPASAVNSPGPDIATLQGHLDAWTLERNKLSETIATLMCFNEATAGTFGAAETQTAVVKAYADALQGITYTYTRNYDPQDILSFETNWGSGYYASVGGLVNALDAEVGKKVGKDAVECLAKYRTGAAAKGPDPGGRRQPEGTPAIDPSGSDEAEGSKEPPLAGGAEDGKKDPSAVVKKMSPEEVAESKAKHEAEGAAKRTAGKETKESGSTDAKPSGTETSSGTSSVGYSSGDGSSSGTGYSSGTAGLEETQESVRQAAAITGGAAIVGSVETEQMTGEETGTAEIPQTAAYTDTEAKKILDSALAEIPSETRTVISRQVMDAPEEYRALILDIMRDDFKITVSDGTPAVAKDGFSISIKELAECKTDGYGIFYDRLGKAIVLKNGKQIEAWNVSNRLSSTMKEEFARYCAANGADIALTEKGYVCTGTEPSGNVQAGVQALQNAIAKEPVFVREAVFSCDPCLRNMTAEEIAKGTAGKWAPGTDAERAGDFLARVFSAELSGTGGTTAFAESVGLARELTAELAASGAAV